MLQRRHHRRRYTTAYKKKPKRGPIVGAVLLVALLVFVSIEVLSFFGIGNTILSASALLSIEDRGVVNVSLSGEPMKRAEDQLKLYPGDAVQTTTRTNASLSFFDGSTVRLDENTHTTVRETYRGEESSSMMVELHEGSLWIATPTLETYSGSITRTIQTPYMSFRIPAETEAVIEPLSLAVFSADGLGITVRIGGSDNEVIIGEGQQFTLPADASRDGDLYTYRSPLDPDRVRSPFVEESRQTYILHKEESERFAEQSTPLQNEVLTVLSPQDGITVDTSTITVNGRIGDAVDRVRVNGYLANIEEGSFTFSQELALPDEDQVDIKIEAEDAEGGKLAEVLRTVTRNRKPPEPPVITQPASAGQTYRTSAQQVEIVGTPPKDAVGIMVNDYRLQLFSPGDTEWSYLANITFDNYTWGENVYEVRAINAGGYESEPAVITIVLGEGEEGIIVDEEAEEEKETEEAKEKEIIEYPDNAPIIPGSIRVTDPEPGETYTASDSAFSILGTTAPSTDTLWVNNYRLRFYEPGSTKWKYVASVDMGTLQRGTNTYEIIARDDRGQILDRFRYTVDFEPGRE